MLLEFQKTVLQQLVRLGDNQKEILRRLDILEAGTPRQSQPSKKVLKVPLTSMEEFDNFEESLIDDDIYKSLVC